MRSNTMIGLRSCYSMSTPLHGAKDLHRGGKSSIKYASSIRCTSENIPKVGPSSQTPFEKAVQEPRLIEKTEKELAATPLIPLTIMALLEAQPALATTNVFRVGDVKCTTLKVDTSSTSSPPKPLLIYTPTVAGVYPVILFCHGFYLRNYFYSDLLHHIASHGFIVVAPQFYEWVPMLGLCEVKSAGKVAEWIAKGLQALLPENVKANLEQLVLAGHSRGGKAAFAVALGHAKTKLKFSALVGIDPVAGPNKICQTCPHILTGHPGSFHLTIPVAVIGTGLGPEKARRCSKPCAPDGVNHKEFFKECNPPCAYFVTKDYGHMDMLLKKNSIDYSFAW